MPEEIRAALRSIPDSITLSHLFCQMPKEEGFSEGRYTKDKLMAYASEKYAWIDSAYMGLHDATTPEAQHAAKLIHAMNKEGMPEELKHA
jgi:hypothetical protein